MSWQRIGEWAFIVCVLIALVGGVFVPNNGIMALTLVVLGIIVGLLNITEKETTPYLVAAIALVAAGTAGFEVLDPITRPLSVGTRVEHVLDYVGNFVAPAAVIVALKSVWGLAKGK